MIRTRRPRRPRSCPGAGPTLLLARKGSRWRRRTPRAGTRWQHTRRHPASPAGEGTPSPVRRRHRRRSGCSNRGTSASRGTPPGWRRGNRSASRVGGDPPGERPTAGTRRPVRAEPLYPAIPAPRRRPVRRRLVPTSPDQWKLQLAHRQALAGLGGPKDVITRTVCLVATEALAENGHHDGRAGWSIRFSVVALHDSPGPQASSQRAARFGR